MGITKNDVIRIGVVFFGGPDDGAHERAARGAADDVGHESFLQEHLDDSGVEQAEAAAAGKQQRGLAVGALEVREELELLVLSERGALLDFCETLDELCEAGLRAPGSSVSALSCRPATSRRGSGS